MSDTRRCYVSALGLLISVIKSKPKLDRDAHIPIFAKQIRKEQIQEIAREWASIKYLTARDAAIPLSEEEMEERNNKRDKDRKNKVNELAQKMRVRALWGLIMPNDKPLHACTFSYVAKINPLFGAIAALGKGQMRKQIDKVFSSAEELEKATKK